MAPITELALPAAIGRFAFGVRFEPQYGLLNKVGEIVDQILRTEGTPYDPHRFPFSQSTTVSHQLHDERGEEQITISHDNLVYLSPELSESSTATISKESSDFSQFVIKPLKAAGLRGIGRFGLLLNLRELGPDLETALSAAWLTRELQLNRDISLRFTKRLPVKEAVIRKAIDDYKQVIYNLERPEKGPTRLSLDFQHYFNPRLERDVWKLEEFERFIGTGLAYLANYLQELTASVRQAGAA